MNMIWLLFKQNLVMLFYLAVGWALYKRKLLTKNGSADMGKLLLYIVMPAAIINSYMREYSNEMLKGFALSFTAALLTLILSMLVSTIFFRRKSSVRQFGAAFSNAGFIGIPLVQMTLGNQAVFYVASFVALLNFFQWTYGVFVMTKDKKAISLKKIVSNPIVISLVIGLLFFFLSIQPPGETAGIISTLSGMNGPLAMIVLGSYLAQISVKELFSDYQAYLCCFVRLLVIPCLTIPILMLIPETAEMIRTSILLAAAAPVGSNVAIFAQMYGKDYREAVKDICLSTFFSILTVPLMVGLSNLVW